MDSAKKGSLVVVGTGISVAGQMTLAATSHIELVELDSNSKLMEAYKKDPVATASDYGLSNEEVKLIKDKNWDEVTKRFDDVNKAIRVINY